jgi:transcription initiation factor TFIID subunit 13
MEPRARIGRNRGLQSFSDQERMAFSSTFLDHCSPHLVQHFLYSHGDVQQSLDTTKRVLDELLTDFITELCFEAHRAAQLAGRQKIKIDDIRFACRKNPVYLGKIEEVQQKKEEIDRARKMVDMNDDKITKSNAKTFEEEPLGDADDDIDVETRTVGGKSASASGR